jgi:hypothetical protein
VSSLSALSRIRGVFPTAPVKPSVMPERIAAVLALMPLAC